jgi:hypothetical protein
MTDQHPLTDEICRQIADTKDRPFTSIEMDNMRRAADWQMKQAIDRFNDYHLKTFGWSTAIIELERLLRPTTTPE